MTAGSPAATPALCPRSSNCQHPCQAPRPLLRCGEAEKRSPHLNNRPSRRGQIQKEKKQAETGLGWQHVFREHAKEESSLAPSHTSSRRSGAGWVSLFTILLLEVESKMAYECCDVEGHGKKDVHLCMRAFLQRYVSAKRYV